MRQNYRPLWGTNLKVVAGINQFLSPTWYSLLPGTNLVELALGVVYTTNFRCGIQCVIMACWFVVVYGSEDGKFQSIGATMQCYHDFTVPMWGSEAARNKTEIHFAKFD